MFRGTFHLNFKFWKKRYLEVQVVQMVQTDPVDPAVRVSPVVLRFQPGLEVQPLRAVRGFLKHGINVHSTINSHHTLVAVENCFLSVG